LPIDAVAIHEACCDVVRQLFVFVSVARGRGRRDSWAGELLLWHDARYDYSIRAGPARLYGYMTAGCRLHDSRSCQAVRLHIVWL